jgi:excisionase family DNA binding protein
MAQSTADRVWLRPREAAEHLGISLSTLYAWRKKGLVRFHRIGPRAVALRREELDGLPGPAMAPDSGVISPQTVERLRALREETHGRYGVLSDSVPVIRAAREREAL